MSQHDLVIDNATGATVRSDLNAALQALGSQQSGSSAPGTPYAYEHWADTTNGVMKRRNAANSAWVLDGPLADTYAQAKAATYTALMADHGTLLLCNGTFDLAFTAAATLGDGWWVDVRNVGSGTVTLNPNGSEQVDGATTVALSAGVSCRVWCSGTAFYTIGRQTSVTATAPMTGARGLSIKNNASNPNYQMDVAADHVILADGSGNTVNISSLSATADITVSGANGLDTGTESISTWYHVWAIYDGSNKRVLLSTSATAPTMPGSYTYKAWLGAIYNNSSGNFLKLAQRGNSVSCEPSVALSNATGQTSYTSLSLSAQVPPQATGARGNMGPVSSGNRGMFVAADGNGVGACGIIPGAAGTAIDGFVNVGTWDLDLVTAQTVYWKTSDTAASNYRVNVTGWRYS